MVHEPLDEYGQRLQQALESLYEPERDCVLVTRCRDVAGTIADERIVKVAGEDVTVHVGLNASVTGSRVLSRQQLLFASDLLSEAHRTSDHRASTCTAPGSPIQTSRRTRGLPLCGLRLKGARGGDIDPFSSTAATLVRRGIPAVVAMQYDISDPAAITFGSTFYTAVTLGPAMEAAVGRRDSQVDPGRDFART